MSVAVALGIAAVIAGGLLVSRLRSRHARADGVEEVCLVPIADGVLVIEDELATVGPSAGTGSGIARESRLTTWRLRDGARVGRLVGEPELHLLGATDQFVWCTSKAMVVHARDPISVAVVHDTRTLAPGIELKALGARDNPVFDTTTRGVHAYTRDGRGLLIHPDLRVAEASRKSVTPAASADACAHGTLRITRSLGDSALKLTLERPGTAESAPEIVVARDAAGGERWKATFPASTITRARHLCVTPERVVFVLGPSPIQRLGEDMDATLVGGHEGYSLLALDAATGALVWEAKL